MEYVYGKKFDTHDHEVKYLVKWAGFKKSESTWEPLDHLFSVKTTVQEYNLIQSRHLFYEKYLNKPMANFVKHGISPAKDDKEGFELLEERKRKQEGKGENRQRRLKRKERNEESNSESRETYDKKDREAISYDKKDREAIKKDRESITDDKKDRETATYDKKDRETISENDAVDGKSEKMKTRSLKRRRKNSKEVDIREKNLKEIEKSNIDIIEVRDRQRKSANREDKVAEEGDTNNNNNKRYFGDFRKNIPLIVSKHRDREKERQKKNALLDQVYYKIDWQIDEDGVRPRSGYFSLDDLKLYCPLLLIEYLEKKARLLGNDEAIEL